MDKTLQLKAAYYARVSTGRQENEATINSQEAEIVEKIKQEGNILPDEYKFKDDGWTGTVLARPGLDALRDVVKDKEVDVIYVYDLGRLSRDFTYQLLLIKEFEDAGIKVISLHDINPQNGEQNFMRHIMGAFHDYERVKIAERFRRGKQFKAKAGILINGGALYGFDYIKKTETENAHYKVNEEEKKAVLLAQEWFGNEQVSINEIIRRFFNLGIYPRKRKQDTWTKGPITRLLRCETYFTGMAYYNKSEAVIAKKPLKKEVYKKINKSSRKARPKEEWIPIKVPIINNDLDLYKRILDRLVYNKKYAKKNRKYDYLLSEKLFCGCGKKRAGDGSSKGGHFYYRCEERLHNFPAMQRQCKIKGMNAQVLDEIFWNELKKQLQDSSQLRKHAEEWLQIQSTRNFDIAEKERLDDQLENISKEEIRYAKAYGAGSLEFDTYKEMMKEVKKRRVSYEKQLSELKAVVSNQAIAIGVDELINEVQSIINKIGLEGELLNKKQVIRDIIETITIKERNEVEVLGHIPLHSTEKLEHEFICWNCGASKRRKKHTI